MLNPTSGPNKAEKIVSKATAGFSCVLGPMGIPTNPKAPYNAAATPIVTISV